MLAAAPFLYFLIQSLLVLRSPLPLLCLLTSKQKEPIFGGSNVFFCCNFLDSC
jgi:hypothetical protein